MVEGFSNCFAIAQDREGHRLSRGATPAAGVSAGPDSNAAGGFARLFPRVGRWCVLCTSVTALGRRLCDYVATRVMYLDSLTGKDLLVLVAHHQAAAEDAEHAERAVLRFDAYVPVADEEHVAKAMHAIAEAARRSADAPDRERLATMRMQLALAHRRAFPEAREPAGPGAEGRQTVTAAASVLAALAAAVGVALGR
jgi:hypothetical protein